MAEPAVGVPPTTGIKQGEPFVLVEKFVFTAKRNGLACQAFDSSNPLHFERGVIPGGLLLGWATERVRDWALGQPEFSGSKDVKLDHVSADFKEFVFEGRPMQLLASVLDMNADYLKIQVSLMRLGVSHPAMEGVISGTRVKKR